VGDGGGRDGLPSGVGEAGGGAPSALRLGAPPRGPHQDGHLPPHRGVSPAQARARQLAGAVAEGPRVRGGGCPVGESGRPAREGGYRAGARDGGEDEGRSRPNQPCQGGVEVDRRAARRPPGIGDEPPGERDGTSGEGGGTLGKGGQGRGAPGRAERRDQPGCEVGR
jgi:hypothetical protein